MPVQPLDAWRSRYYRLYDFGCYSDRESAVVVAIYYASLRCYHDYQYSFPCQYCPGVISALHSDSSNAESSMASSNVSLSKSLKAVVLLAAVSRMEGISLEIPFEVRECLCDFFLVNSKLSAFYSRSKFFYSVNINLRHLL